MALEFASIDHLFHPSSAEITSRAGVIPYARVMFEGGSDVEEIWLLGTLRSNRLSDFGGSCSITRGESTIDCLLREVDEESNSLLTEPIAQCLENGSNDSIYVWRWVNRNRPDEMQYLLFVEVDYVSLQNIGDIFTGNEENTSLNWYTKEDLMTNYSVEDFNTSIQKFLRRFGFRSRNSPRSDV